MSSPIFLCLVNGPWQALSLVATLEQQQLDPRHALALLVDMQSGSAFHAAASRILHAHGLTRQHTIEKNVALRQLPAVLRALEQEGVDLTRVDWVASYGMHRPIARYFLNVLPRARVLIYEEGLRAYVPPSTSLRDRARMKLAKTWGRLDREFGRGWTPPRAWKDVEYGLLLSERLPLPAETRAARVHPVKVEHLRAAMARVPAPAVHGLPERPYALIVGQYYAQLKQMTPQAELAAYVAVARAIEARGHVPVWRGHFREHDALFAALSAQCASVRNFSEFVDDPSLPLELYRDFFGPGCAAAVSFSSSALFYLAYVHGTPTYTLMTDEVLARMRYPHRDACLLAHRHVPSFASSPYGSSRPQVALATPAPEQP